MSTPWKIRGIVWTGGVFGGLRANLNSPSECPLARPARHHCFNPKLCRPFHDGRDGGPLRSDHPAMGHDPEFGLGVLGLSFDVDFAAVPCVSQHARCDRVAYQDARSSGLAFTGALPCSSPRHPAACGHPPPRARRAFPGQPARPGPLRLVFLTRDLMLAISSRGSQPRAAPHAPCGVCGVRCLSRRRSSPLL